MAKPQYIKSIKCCKCGYEIYSGGVRECPHPKVKEQLGEDICHWCCMKCKFNKNEVVGQSCSYKEDIGLK